MKANKLNDFTVMDFRSELGRNIYIIRKALSINHLDLVDKIGLSRPIISNIENGKANPTIESILKLREVFDISEELLFMTKREFLNLSNLLRQTFLIEKLNKPELLIPEENWKMFLKYSGSEEKSKISKVVRLLPPVIKLNFPNSQEENFNNMILGAALGVIFQKDGFQFGLELGAWLGQNITKEGL